MKEFRAQLNYVRVSPRKARLLADLMRGRSIADADLQLKGAEKQARHMMRKLLISCMANAKHAGEENTAHMVVKRITVDAGPTLKRFMPRAHGRASTIRKRTSRITLVVGEK